MATRVIAFVDGFNLYHAVCELGDNHLKWLDLRALARAFALPPEYDLQRVLYFTAYAMWRKDAWRRHRAYTAALEASDVEVVLSTFKKKERYCKDCGKSYWTHEEKETDVSVGAHLVDLAHADAYDRALLITGDSDLRPAIQLVRKSYPEKAIKVLTPPGRKITKGLTDVTGIDATRIKRVHVEQSLLPSVIVGPDGTVMATRPAEYDPPPGLGR